MKIKYEFINGETTEIKVDENIGTFILDSRRIESNPARKERYHCYSADAIIYEGHEFTDQITPETALLKKIESDKLCEAIKQLSPLQTERLLKLASGMSIRKIAESEGKHHSAVEESIAVARKKLKNFL